MTAQRQGFYREFGKRALDVVLTLSLLPILAPTGVIVAAVIRLTLGSPVLFRQLRVGRRSQTFVLLKLRTMAEGDAPDAERLSSIGRFLRRTGLDEIPEFLNILKGDMSLVGPRPLLPEYLPLYSTEQSRRHDVSPGLTGLAQVRGRNDTTWSARLQHDVDYVENLSFGLDLSILVRTLWLLVSGWGVSAPGHATMPPFEGTDEETAQRRRSSRSPKDTERE